jgi:hypothetical protein
VVRFRTIRQRRDRARKGVVSLVATLLAMLVFASYLGGYLLVQLPQQEATLEYQHELQVETQLLRLQARLLAQAQNALPLALSDPVTLGAQPDPPFGLASAGAIVGSSPTTRIVAGYTVSHAVMKPVLWGFGSPCLNGTTKKSTAPGSGKCSGQSSPCWQVTPIECAWTYNYSSTKTGVTLSVTITSSANGASLLYNIYANRTTLNVAWSSGNSASGGVAQVVVLGSNDTVAFSLGGPNTNRPAVSFIFYGQNDHFTMNTNGVSSSSGATNPPVSVDFVGAQTTDVCPPSAMLTNYGNYTTGDAVTPALSPAGSNITVNLTVQWWNSIGYFTPVHIQPYPLKAGSAPDPFANVAWSNQSGPFPCPFATLYSSTYSGQAGGTIAGFVVHLYNRYSAPVDVAYENGGVVFAQPGAGSAMVGAPPLAVTTAPTGRGAALTLVLFVAPVGQLEAGTGTAAVVAQVTGVATETIGGANLVSAGNFISGDVTFSVTTAYPAAWKQFFSNQTSVFDAIGTFCQASFAIHAPNSCWNPPAGRTVTVVTHITVQQLTLTTVTVQAGLD